MSRSEHFKEVPEYRARYDAYRLWSLLTIVLLAVLCGAPRGQKDWQGAMWHWTLFALRMKRPGI